MALIVFHGTAEEGRMLSESIGRNCACTFDTMGKTISRCEPHRALLEDQRFVDDLVFMRRYFAIHRPDAARRTILSRG